MKTKKLILSMMALLGVNAFLAISAYATTYYVRDGGGNYGTTSTTCNGQTNAAFTGSNGPNCALNHPSWVIGEGGSTVTLLKGGDTLYIDGDSDVNQGQQAKYLVGYGMPNTSGSAYGCGPGVSTPTCSFNSIPAGSSATAQTHIIGTGNHYAALTGSGGIGILLDLQAGYIDLENMEITSNANCLYDGPVGPNGVTTNPDGFPYVCPYTGSNPPFYSAKTGIQVGGTGETLTNVLVHGLYNGINNAVSGGVIGNITFTNVKVFGNSSEGISIGQGQSVDNVMTGTLTFMDSQIDFNGCGQRLPLKDSTDIYKNIATSGLSTSIDDEANYYNCYGQDQNGYGDGVAFGPNGGANAGNWSIINSSISFNTQDGLDTLHGNGNGTIEVVRSRMEGNAGQQVKLNGKTEIVENSLINGDCARWLGAPETSTTAGSAGGDATGFYISGGGVCRAMGDVAVFVLTSGTQVYFYNNTINANGIVIEGNGSGCDSTTGIHVYNNIVNGGVYAAYDSAISWSQENDQLVPYTYLGGSDGDGTGSCGPVGNGSSGVMTFDENYNIVYNTKNNNAGCNGSHDKCGVAPGFIGTIPMGTLDGGASTFYHGTAMDTLETIGSNSPTIKAGVAGLTYVNGSEDYNGSAQDNPPDDGAFQYNSVVIPSLPMVSITSPSSGSSLISGSNVTITATASETGGTIKSVSFYNGTVLLGTETTTPYSYTETNVPTGTYTLTAIATDANGVSTTSSSVIVTVNSSSVAPSSPVVSITGPANGSSFTSGSNVTVTATSSETNGTISKISIYNGEGILLGSSSTSPFSYVDTDLLSGTYTFYAVATDANGVSTTSNSITVTVTAPSLPVVAITSPANGGSFATGSSISIVATASESNGTISKVQFFNGATLLGTTTNSPYNFTWSSVAAGSYSLTAVAYDNNNNQTTSTAVNVTVSSANANSWYVRDGGGTSAQCTGKTNAVYPGSGTAQACAFNNPRYAIGWDSDNPQPQKMVGGDTIYINGDSDINPGQQAQYLIGYDNTSANSTPDCSSSYPWDCTLANLPAGLSATQRTSIIGTGTHKPQLWGNERPWQVLTADNNHILLQWLEITDHSSCGYADPVNGCNYGGSYPFGSFGMDGMYIGGDDINLTDIYIHGFAHYGMNTDNFGSATFTRVWVIGNTWAGISTGTAATVSGTLTFNQPIIEWNGCEEAYPLTGGIDNPANYSNCFGQDSGGYGDGLAFGNDGNGNAGNWTIIGPGSISFNVQDGLDTLHGNGNGTIQIDKMRFEGNAGNQVKINANTGILTNSVVIADCGWWDGAPQSAPGAMLGGDACRANGDAIVLVTNAGGGTKQTIYNNTIISNGNIVLLQDGSCDSTDVFNVKNNLILGGYVWADDTTFNGGGGNSQTTYLYNGGTDGDGAGCSGLVVNEDYNIVSGTKNNNEGCAGAHDKCGTAPGFASGTFPMGTSGGGRSTYYTGQAGETLVGLSSSSAAVGAGTTGLTYWNNANDYHNVTRTNPPSIGGVEENSCAINSYGCLFSSDCCGGASCTNFVCGTSNSIPQPVVSITSPTSGSNFTAGTNVTITTNASEAGGAITNISIYNGSALLGSSSSSPYNYVMTKAAAGTYTLTAKATDANGVSTTSNPITVVVENASILSSPPVVAITSPVSGSSLASGSNLTITTIASETNGTISNISLYNGSGILLGSSSTSPYNFMDINMAAGSYTFYAVAKDVNGVSTTSSPITVTVTSPSLPVVAITSPANGSTFIRDSTFNITVTASETNGTIANVSFYNGTTLMGTMTTPPYTMSWTNSSFNSYALTAVAKDANGVSTTSSPVIITLATPSVAITSPVNGSSFTAGSNVTLTATASESNGTISKVEFFNGAILLGTATSSPYTFTWSSVAAGTYSLTAVATDSTGVTTTSSTVSVIVNSHIAPTVQLTSPSNDATYTAPASITLTANATANNATISKVAFYSGATLIGTVTTSPYNLTWVGVSIGTYSLTAVATDSTGTTSTSTAVAVKVSGLPIVSLAANNTSFTAPASIILTATASESNGTISKVEFFNGSTLLGTATSSPYSFTWDSVAAGNYNLTAEAFDNNNKTTTSTAVAVTVSGLPTVSLAANNTSFTAPASIILTATASESNGTISKVEFFNGSTLLGTATSSPYSFTWSNVAVGNYNLTAEAFDNNNKIATSTVIAVAVVTPSVPKINITSPASGSSFVAGSSVTITTTATETNGTISNIYLYNGSNVLLGSSSKSPYNYVYTDIPAGNYSFYATVVDANGVLRASSSITITVTVPVVAITSPSNGSSLTAGSNINITASASEANGTISKVEFFNGSTLLGTSTSSPYSFTWSSVTAGKYSLTAEAFDNNNNHTTSTSVAVTVLSPPPVSSAPVVAITSPANASTFTAGSNVSITASASETNGTIAKVSFYNGSTLLGTSKKSPYSFKWKKVIAGTYTLTAKAIDTKGNSTTSSPIKVTVKVTSPVVAITGPANASAFTAGSNISITASASETNGAIATVSFYNGSTLLGTSKRSPYSFKWKKVIAGTYTLTAKATDTKGISTMSSPVKITVTKSVKK